MADRSLVVWTDGAARGNPGPAGIGFVIEDDDGAVIEEGHAYLGERTNNQAEYEALIAALERIVPDSDTHLSIYSDSELMVRQLNGEYRVRDADLQRRYVEAIRMINRAGSAAILHVQRAENDRADALANRGIDEHLCAQETGGQTAAGD